MFEIISMYGDFRKEKIQYNWSDHTFNNINLIIEEWLSKNYADSVLFFFQEDDKKLYAYMPILYYRRNKKLNNFDVEGEVGSAKIIGVEPICIDCSELRICNIELIALTMGRDHLWFGNKVFEIKK